MELRRALLLFAIVLGVAAVVAAVAGPASRDADRTKDTAPSPQPAPAGGGRPPARVRVDGRGAPVTRRLETGRATTVVVTVAEPGQVELEGLGLVDAAEPRDPAVFETLPVEGGRYRVLFAPAGSVQARSLGELVSRPGN